MTIGSLFSGIGGLDLGLERAGHTVRWQVEANPYCRRILAQHWPDIPCYPDVTHLTAETLEPVDLICGGFPCQPVSVAGSQKGTDDDRWLWPHFSRLLRVLRPRYALLENVPGLLTANGGHAFGAILADLADSGYDAEWDHLPAAAVGAPHLRYRVFIIASLPDADRLRPYSTENNDGARTPQSHLAGRSRWVQSERCVSPCQEGQAVADADGSGCHPRAHPGSTLPPASGEESRKPQSGRVTQTPDHRRAGTADVADADRTGPQGRELLPQRAGERAPGAGGLADADDQSQSGGSLYAGAGASLSEFASSHQWWESEPDVGRVAHGVPQRVDRLKALGNAVVPQVAEWLGRRLTAHAEDRL